MVLYIKESGVKDNQRLFSMLTTPLSQPRARTTGNPSLHKTDKPMAITEPAVASTRLLSLSAKLYPSNMPRMVNKDFSRFMLSLSRIRQNRASGRKTLLARVENWQLTVSTSSDQRSFCKESSERL